MNTLDFPNLEIAANGCIAPPCIAALSMDQLAEISNGCGPAGDKNKILTAVISDHFGDCDWYPSCSGHDAAYAFGETEEDKQWGDILLLLNGLFVVNKAYPGDSPEARCKRWAARRVIWEYYMKVAGWGDEAFWAGKERP